MSRLGSSVEFTDHFTELEVAESLLFDERSRETLRALVLHALTLDQTLLDEVFTSDMYFFAEPFALHSSDTFIDVGAFDGDTVRDIHARYGTNFKAVHCFEPNDANYAELLGVIERYALGGKVIPHKQGLSDRSQKVSFAGSGSGFHRSAVDTPDICELVSFDQSYPDIKPDFIKMDIEGGELEALRGMENNIRTRKPRLAICAYHEPRHLWELPTYIQSLVPEYKLFLRHHTRTRLETVLYATL